MWGRGQEPFGGSPSGGLFDRYRRGHPLGVAGKRVGHIRFVSELGGDQMGTGDGKRAPCPARRETAWQASPTNATRSVVQRGISIWETWS
jgi:hypothetical protein